MRIVEGLVSRLVGRQEKKKNRLTWEKALESHSPQATTTQKAKEGNQEVLLSRMNEISNLFDSDPRLAEIRTVLQDKEFRKAVRAITKLWSYKKSAWISKGDFYYRYKCSMTETSMPWDILYKTTDWENLDLFDEAKMSEYFDQRLAQHFQFHFWRSKEENMTPRDKKPEFDMNYYIGVQYRDEKIVIAIKRGKQVQTFDNLNDFMLLAAKAVHNKNISSIFWGY